MWGNLQFRGMIPRTPVRQLPVVNAEIARNCWLDGAQPRPVPALRNVNGAGQPIGAGLSFGLGVRSLYRFDADRWFQWDEDVSVVRAPIREDASLRTVWTGDGAPKQTTLEILAAGGFTSPGLPRSRQLGVAAPDAPPVVTLGSYTSEDTDAVAESHAWVYTFLTDLQEEGPPSNPSPVETRGFNTDGSPRPATIVTATAAQGATGVTHKRIYRVAVGLTGSLYRLVATIPIAQGSFTDTIQTAELGSELISTEWDPPPADIKGLIALPNGVLAAFKGRDVYFSEPYQPHAWPATYIQSLEFDVIGLGNYGVNLVVGTAGRPYIILGNHPADMTAVQMEMDQPCVAPKSFASVDQMGVVYASNEGLILVAPGKVERLTKELYSKADWAALNPGTIRAVYHDGSYVMWTDTRCVAIDPMQGGVVEIDDAGILAVYQDWPRDRIYLIDSAGIIVEWKTKAEDGAQDRMRTLVWRSAMNMGLARNFAAAQVIAPAYPVTFRLIADQDSSPVVTKVVRSRAPFRLPTRLGSDWQYEVEAANPVLEVRIGDMQEML